MRARRSRSFLALKARSCSIAITFRSRSCQSRARSPTTFESSTLFACSSTIAGRAAGARRGETSRSYRCAESRPPTKGTPVELAFDERGERVDIGKRLAELAQRRAEKYGRIHETLFHRIEQAKESERVPSSYGRDSNWPPRPTRSPPIAVRSSRPTAKRRLVAQAAQGSCRCRARSCSVRRSGSRRRGRSTRPCRRCVRPRRSAQIRRLAAEQGDRGDPCSTTSPRSTTWAIRSPSPDRTALMRLASTAPASASRSSRMVRASRRT